jgi:hypothetical protein
VNEAYLNMIITWVISFVAGAFGVGVGYATLRTQLKAFIHEFDVYKDTASSAAAAASVIAGEQLINIKERVSKIEGKTEAQVGYDRCRDMRDECNRRLGVQISDLSRQVSENRTIVTTALQEIHTFIGRVDAHMAVNGRKNNA